MSSSSSNRPSPRHAGPRFSVHGWREAREPIPRPWSRFTLARLGAPAATTTFNCKPGEASVTVRGSGRPGCLAVMLSEVRDEASAVAAYPGGRSAVSGGGDGAALADGRSMPDSLRYSRLKAALARRPVLVRFPLPGAPVPSRDSPRVIEDRLGSPLGVLPISAGR